MQHNHALFILDEEDERIYDLVLQMQERGASGMKGFTFEPERKTIVGERKDGTTFPLEYGEFERWFSKPLLGRSMPEMLELQATTEDEKLAAKIIVSDLNSRLDATSTVERFFVDVLAEKVIQINADGTRRPVSIRGFVQLFTPRS